MSILVVLKEVEGSNDSVKPALPIRLCGEAPEDTPVWNPGAPYAPKQLTDRKISFQLVLTGLGSAVTAWKVIFLPVLRLTVAPHTEPRPFRARGIEVLTGLARRASH